jgi:hypothetical protein
MKAHCEILRRMITGLDYNTPKSRWRMPKTGRAAPLLAASDAPASVRDRGARLGGNAMLRTFVTACAVFGLLVVTGLAVAAEYKGSVTKVDADKGVITVKVDDKEMEIQTDKDTKFLNAKDKDLKAGLKGLKAKANVIVTTDKKDGKEVATKVQLKGK